MDRSLQRLIVVLMLLGCWVVVLSLTPGCYAQDGRARFNQGLQAFRAGEMQKTASLLEENLKSHPNDAPSHELLGLALSELGNSSKALRHLREAVRLWPDQPSFWTNLAIFYLRQSRTQDGEKALQRSLEVKPSPSALRLMGLIRLNQQRYEEAERAFSKALELAHDDVDSWYYLGLAQQAQAHPVEALHCYREVLNRAPNDFHTHIQMGTVLLNQGKRQQALVHFQEAQGIRPRSPEVYQLLSEAYLGIGDLRRALKSARHAVALMPKDRQAHYQLGLVLARLGDRDESQKEFAISQSLPKTQELTPLERWRELTPSTPVRK